MLIVTGGREKCLFFHLHSCVGEGAPVGRDAGEGRKAGKGKGAERCPGRENQGNILCLQELMSIHSLSVCPSV